MLTAARALFRAAACLMILALAVAPAAARPWRVIVYRPLAPRVVIVRPWYVPTPAVIVIPVKPAAGCQCGPECDCGPGCRCGEKRK